MSSRIPDDASSSSLSSAPDDLAERNETPDIPETKGAKRYNVGGVTPTPRKRVKKVHGVEEGDLAETSTDKKARTITKTTKVSVEVKVVVDPQVERNNTATKQTRRVTETRILDLEVQDDDDTEVVPAIVRKSKKGKKAQEGTGKELSEGEGFEGAAVKGAVKRKRKTKEEKEAEAMPLAARTVGSRLFIGAHVSIASGVHNAVTNCVQIGYVRADVSSEKHTKTPLTNTPSPSGNAFALFLKSQRKWENPPLQPDHITQFHAHCAEHSYSANAHVLPHGSYLVNLAAAEPAKASQAYASFVDDVRRCSALGIRHYNFHPGNTNGAPRDEAIARIADALNRAHAATQGSGVVTLLENMAASATSSNTVGGAFEDLRDIIALVEDKTRVGVTLDTCHAFAAGYDLRTPAAYADVMRRFDAVVGGAFLKAVHVNDSKAPLGSHRDLHQNIGLGFLGLRAFHNLVNDARFAGLPLVLETPVDRKDAQTGKSVEDKGVWAREIKLLEGLVGMDAEGEEFRGLENRLAGEGAEERAKYQEAFEKKLEKERKKTDRGGTKKKKKKKKMKGGESVDESSLSSAGEGD